jgi:hypothetical protein
MMTASATPAFAEERLISMFCAENHGPLAPTKAVSIGLHFGLKTA